VVVGSLLLVHQGIVAISWLQAGIAVLAQIVTIGIAQRMFGIHTRRVVIAVLPPLLASTGLAIALYAVHKLISAPWPAVIAGGLVSLPVYLILLHLCSPTLLPQLRRTAFPGRASQDPHPGEFESAIAAHDVDAMVRPATIGPRETS
jgi:hypothetical protein